LNKLVATVQLPPPIPKSVTSWKIWELQTSIQYRKAKSTTKGFAFLLTEKLTRKVKFWKF